MKKCEQGVQLPAESAAQLESSGGSATSASAQLCPRTGPGSVCAGPSSRGGGRIWGDPCFPLCPVSSRPLILYLCCEEPTILTLQASWSSFGRRVKAIAELELDCGLNFSVVPESIVAACNLYYSRQRNR